MHNYILAVLFDLPMLALLKSQMTSLSACQRKMIRSNYGWRRIAGEDWEDIMRKIAHELKRFRKANLNRAATAQILHASIMDDSMIAKINASYT